MQTARKRKRNLLSAHDRLLNFSENMGTSLTNSHDDRHTSSNSHKG